MLSLLLRRLKDKEYAKNLEKHIYSIYPMHNDRDNQKLYIDKGRSLSSALKENQLLIDDLLADKINVETLCTMSANELASKNLQEERKAMKEASLKNIIKKDSEFEDDILHGKFKAHILHKLSTTDEKDMTNNDEVLKSDPNWKPLISLTATEDEENTEVDIKK